MAGQSKARVEDESTTPEAEQLEKNLIEILAKKADADASQINRDQNCPTSIWIPWISSS